MAAFGASNSTAYSSRQSHHDKRILTPEHFTDTPWLSSMPRSTSYTPNNGSSTPQPTYDPNPPTVAAFSPTATSGYAATSKQRSTIILRKKSPLLVATPPQITRALAHSHPFLLPLNRLAGLLTWTSNDPWESYLLVAVFWATTLYGDAIMRFASPIIIVTGLILAMYSRRYSPLSSTSKTGEKSSSPHHNSLDDIVDNLSELTNRCNILLGPFLSLTDFLSTQTTPTAATTRPALTTLFIRIVFISPIWIILTLPPLHLITSRRIILFIGTTTFTWHSRPARVTRAVLWRSVFIRRLSSFVTGLDFSTPTPSTTVDTSFPELSKPRSHQAAIKLASSPKARSSGVRFTFILYENQRRWIGLGWTTSLFAYERGPWTDEHLNPAPSKDEFDLPDVEGGNAKWRWLEGSTWKIERGDAKQHARSASKGSNTGPTGGKDLGESDGGGWIYYDNRWEDGQVKDGWGRYTRRRKWYRDAELVEVDPSERDAPAFPSRKEKAEPEGDNEEERARKAKEYAQALTSASATAPSSKSHTQPIAIPPKPPESEAELSAVSTSAKSPTSKKLWFGKGRSDSKSSSSKNTGLTQTSTKSRDEPEDNFADKWRDHDGRHRGFSVQEDVVMGLG